MELKIPPTKILYRMKYLDEPGFAVSIAIFIFGLALALPNISLGYFGFDFSTFPTSAITIMRLGLIALAVTIGTRPLESDFI